MNGKPPVWYHVQWDNGTAWMTVHSTPSERDAIATYEKYAGTGIYRIVKKFNTRDNHNTFVKEMQQV